MFAGAMLLQQMTVIGQRCSHSFSQVSKDGIISDLLRERRNLLFHVNHYQDYWNQYLLELVRNL